MRVDEGVKTLPTPKERSLCRAILKNAFAEHTPCGLT
jgi:hypothetical protein